MPETPPPDHEGTALLEACKYGDLCTEVEGRLGQALAAQSEGRSTLKTKTLNQPRNPESPPV